MYYILHTYTYRVHNKGDLEKKMGGKDNEFELSVGSQIV